MSIFTYETQELDLKESIKLRTKCQQLDTIILNFNIYDYDVAVDLTGFNIEFRAVKSDGTIYSQVEDITKVGNLLTISCNNQLTAVNGKVNCQLRIWDNLGNQKSSYYIILTVSSIVESEDRIVSRTLIDALEHLDNSINRAIELDTDLDASIDEAEAMNTTLNDTFSTAINTIKPALDSSVSSSVFARMELDGVNTMAQALKDEILGLAPSINNHISDEDVHVTKSEKDNWNSRWAMIEQILDLVDIFIASSPILTETGDIIVTEDGSTLTV